MKLIQVISLFTAASLLAFGCAGGKPYDPDVENPTSGFSIGPVGSKTVALGGTAVFPVTVFKTLAGSEGRATGDVTLSVDGLPGDATAEFTVNPVTPTLGGTELELHVQTGIQTDAVAGEAPQPETFTLTITGTDGHETHSVTTTLTVNPFEVPDDFVIDNIPTRTVFSGGEATFPITVRTVQGGGSSRAPANVTLTVTGGQPTGTKTFTVNPVLPTLEGAKSKLKILTDDGEGDFPVTVTGTDGVHTHSVTTTIRVRFPDN